MIWIKTDIGRAEIGARALVHERARRNLLLLIDGVRSQDSLLGSVTGIGHGDFDQLARLGLIAEGAASASPDSQPAPLSASVYAELDLIVGEAYEPLSYAQLSSRLTRLISSELGLRGFRLTLAVEKAANVQELDPVAAKALAEIAKRKGNAVADAARRALYSA